VEEGAVPELLEEVGRLGERREPDPLDAFPAHLGDADHVAIHGEGEPVAADPRRGEGPSGTTVERLCGQPEQK
jgi:hypothetical protein